MKNKVTSTTQVGLRGRSWSWQQYLDQENAPAAPEELFNQYQRGPCRGSGGFKVGMKLEGVDPFHQTLFCVLTVSEVIGCRLRLHFDGWSDSYDFWMNADSPEIRPPGFCRRTNRTLQPPRGVLSEAFDWSEYLQRTESEAAPDSAFYHDTATESAPCCLKKGMKLEAVDRMNPGLVCVASVSDLIQDRVLVHFDDWDESYDYWSDCRSPYVHPVGWCQEQGRPLTAPKAHPDPEHFLWDEYLNQTGSEPAPPTAFTESTAQGFQVNHRLEAVDRRNPVLIRVGTVAETTDLRIRVHYDGWPALMDAWFDCDHPDLHPIGFCQRTGHPLEPPRGFGLDWSQGVCPTVGCRGVGHIRGPKYTGHHSLFGCPYSDSNLRKDLLLPDRLGPETGSAPGPERCEYTAVKRRRLSHRAPEVGPAGLGPAGLGPAGLGPAGLGPAGLGEEEELSTDPVLVRSRRFLSALSPQPNRDLSLCWDQHRKLLPPIHTAQAQQVHTWTIQEVSDFVESLPGCEEQAQLFKAEEIDGRAFLLLTQSDIIRILSIKLGPALKIYHCILMFRHERGQSQSPNTVT